MKLRNIAAIAATAGTLFVGGTFVGHEVANASGTTVGTVKETKTIVNSKCYKDVRVTTTYYHHSAKYGWVLYPSPRVTTTKSEHCYK
jgi:hypothetical protein